MDGVKDGVVVRAPRARRAQAPWLWILLVSALLMPGCGFDLAASQPRSRHQTALERAFPDPRAQALAIAAEHGNAAEVRRLMQDEGVNPDVVFGGYYGGMPLLAWPIYSQSPEGLRAMLAAGADPNAKKSFESDNGGMRFHGNAMVWAAEQEDPVYLGILLDHGGDPDTQNANGESLLFHAFIKHNQWRNVQYLIERGADINAEASAGRTILRIYTSRGGFMMAHWLLERGADPTLDYAYRKPVQNPDSHAIQAIFWHPGNPDDPTWQRECQQWLLGHGHERPPMPDHYQRMRERLEFPHNEGQIPLL